MAGELLPPLDLAPPVPHDSTFAERIELWKDLMNTCERFLLAGLRMEIGPDGDLDAAYAAWLRGRQAERDREWDEFARRQEELERRRRERG